MITKALEISSVLTGMPSRFQEVSPATMVHYCTWFRQIVDFCQNVHLITRAESSHAQCAQNKFALKYRHRYSHRNKTAYFTWTTHLASHSLPEQSVHDTPASLQVRQENKIPTKVKMYVLIWQAKHDKSGLS